MSSLSWLNITNNDVNILERFIIFMCDRTSAHVSINDTRQDIFVRGNQQIDYIPSTKAALEQNIKRAMLQSHVWHCCLISMPNTYNPLEYG